MSTQRSVVRTAVAMTAVALAFASPAAAQEHAGHGQQQRQHGMEMPTAGLRAELIRDVEQLEAKFTGLAKAMAGKYGYRPADGVRSAGEVFMHVAGANFMLPTMWGGHAPEMLGPIASMQDAMAKMRELEQMTDEAKLQEMLAHSFRHAKHMIAMVPDAELDAAIQLFGREATKRAGLNLMVTHMHEHLGQSIAYARASGVVPPWSEGD